MNLFKYKHLNHWNLPLLPHDRIPCFHKAVKSHTWLENVSVLFFRGGRCLLSECYWKHLMSILRAGIWQSGVGVVATDTTGLGGCLCGTAEPTDSHATHQTLHHDADQVKQECIFLEFICTSQFPSLPSLFALASNLSNLCWPWEEGSGELSFLDKVALDAEPHPGNHLANLATHLNYVRISCHTDFRRFCQK